MKRHKLIIVDDHQLFRVGLRHIIEEFPEVEVVGEASNGEEFLKLLKIMEPEIVLLDIKMPLMNGMEAAKKALEINPGLSILVLSMFDDERYYNSMIGYGVKGFLLKEADGNELHVAIKNIIEGKHYFSQDLLLNLLKNKDDNVQVKLTPREKEVLALICRGQSNAQIADKLSLSQRTIERHRSNLLLKTESVNSISLAIFAVKNNLVDI